MAHRANGRVLLLLLAMVPDPGVGQTTEALTPGQPVRVSARCELLNDRFPVCRADAPIQTYTGWFESRDLENLRIRMGSGGEEIALPAAFISGVSVMSSGRGNFWLGALAGTVAGAVGGAFASSQHSFCIGDCTPPSRLLGAFLGGLGGFVIGGLIGSQIPTVRWRPIFLTDGDVAGPRLDRVGFAVEVRF